MYKFKNDDLKLTCINLTGEIKKSNKLLKSKEITVFNSSVLPIKNSKNFLVASRGWYGNIRTWDGLNFIILSIFDENYKKIKQNIIDIDLEILKEKNLKFKEFKQRIIEHQKTVLEGPEDPRLFYYNGDNHILVNEIDEPDKNPRRRLMYLATIDIKTLDYKTPKQTVCKQLSTNFEKIGVLLTKISYTCSMILIH